MFLCVLATVFGVGPEGDWFALPPDYTGMGWSMRIVGGVIGCALFVYLCVAHRENLAKRRSRSFSGKMARIGMAVSIATIAWEFAVMGLVIVLLFVLAYGLFGEGI